MKMKYVFALALLTSIGVQVYHAYSTPTHATPTSTLPNAEHTMSKGSKQPLPVPVVRATPTPTPDAIVRSAKGRVTLSPAISHSDTLAGRMDRANGIKVQATTTVPFTTTVSKGIAVPLYTTTVQGTPTVRPYIDKGSVTGARRVLPVLSGGKNHGVRYNGKDTIKPNQNHGTR